jgi:hypothetical protein
MESYKLHLKIGLHEFSAEGPTEQVKQDFELWKTMIDGLPTGSKGSAQSLPGGDKDISTAEPPDKQQLERVYLLDERHDLLSLRILPRSDDRNGEALLLLMLGFRLAKGLDEVMVTQLKPALRQSGCLVERVDQVAGKYVRQGLLNKGGMGKGGRYSLTNLGLERATTLLGEIG